MPELTVLASFSLASILLILAPGPDNLYVIAQSARHGFRSGLFVTLGLCSGLLFHTLAVVLGVAVLIKESALALTILKILGAMYLLYLAWQMWRHQEGNDNQTNAPQLSSKRLYLRGVVMNISNPKVSLFFLAFLPQFADPTRTAVELQILLFGALFLVLALGTFSLFAWLASRKQANRLVPTTLQGWLEKFLALTFVALATRLLWSEAK